MQNDLVDRSYLDEDDRFAASGWRRSMVGTRQGKIALTKRGRLYYARKGSRNIRSGCRWRMSLIHGTSNCQLTTPVAVDGATTQRKPCPNNRNERRPNLTKTNQEELYSGRWGPSSIERVSVINPPRYCPAWGKPFTGFGTGKVSESRQAHRGSV
jgi:hypothetical protein